MRIKSWLTLSIAIGLLSLLLISPLLAACSQPAPSSAPPPASSAPATSAAPSATSSPSSSAKPSGQVLNLRFATQWPEPSPNYVTVIKPILDEIKQKSNGRIQFTVFSGPALGPPEQMYDFARTGKSDISNASPAYTPGRFLMTEVLSLPGAYGVTNQADEDMTLAVGDRILYKEYVGVQPISYWMSQPFLLYTANKQVKVLDDMKGLKLRQPGGLLAQAIQALGGVPINMVMGDMYVSLQTGVIEGAAIGPSAIVSYKLNEVLKYVTKYNMGYAVQTFVANPDTWKTIPDDLKPVVKDAFRKAGSYEVTMFKNDDPVVVDLLTKRGGGAYTLTADEEAKWNKAEKSMVDSWIADMKSKNQPVDELMNTVREECKKQNIAFPY